MKKFFCGRPACPAPRQICVVRTNVRKERYVFHFSAGFCIIWKKEKQHRLTGRKSELPQRQQKGEGFHENIYLLPAREDKGADDELRRRKAAGRAAGRDIQPPAAKSSSFLRSSGSPTEEWFPLYRISRCPQIRWNGIQPAITIHRI